MRFTHLRPYRIGGGRGAESGALSVANRRLLTAAGDPWFGVGVSWFTGLQDWIEDRAKAEAFLAWAVSRGLQWERVFGMYNGGIGRFIPALYPDYFRRWRELTDRCAEVGQRIEAVVNADCQKPPLSFDPGLFDGVAWSLLGAWNVLALSGGNELPFNGVDALRLTKPQGLLSARGSMGTDAAPFRPWWDLDIYETPRDAQMARKYKGVWDIYDAGGFVPILIDEMIGIGDVDEPGRTTASPFDCWQLTAGAKMVGAAGICGHLRAGITGNVPAPGGFGEQCIDAMVAAGKLPLGANAFAHYERGLAPDQGQNPNLPILHHDREASPDLDYPGSSAGSWRTHAFIAGNRAEVIAPGPGPDYRAIAANGWRIVDAYAFPGHEANVLVCER